MALTVKKVTVVSTRVEDKPGMLAKMTAALREANINLMAMVGHPGDEGQAWLTFIPEDPAALRALAAQEGVQITEEAAVWLEGPDQVGALCAFADKLAAENINIVAGQATGAGGYFAAVFYFASEQVVDQVVKLMTG